MKTERKTYINPIIENALDAVITIDSDSIISGWNKQAETTFGWSRQEAIGLRLSDTIIPVRYHEAHERGMRHCLATGEGPMLNNRVETMALHRSGREFPVELTVIPLQIDDALAFSAFVRDITERKQGREALQESEARIRAVLDTAAEGIITIDEQGLIESFNPAAAHIFGYDIDEMLGHNVSMLMPEPHGSRHDSYLSNYQNTGQAKILGSGREIEGRRKGGSIFPIYLAVSEVKLGNRRIFTGIVRDISDLKQAEASLQRLSNELEQRVAERTAQLAQANAELSAEIAERKQLENQYRVLFEEAPAMYVITKNIDNVPYIKDCNQLFAVALGYSRQDILGQALFDFYTAESRIELIAGGYQRALTGEFTVEDRQLATKDGRMIETLLRARPELDSKGNVIGTRAMFTDITKRKQIEAAEREQRILAEALREAALVISTSLDFDTVLDHILEQIARVIPYDGINIMLVEHGRTRTVRLHGYEQFGQDVAQEVALLSFDIMETPNLYNLMQTRQPIIIADTAEHPDWKAGAITGHCRSWAAAPICIRDEVVAFLLLDKIEPDFYQPKDAKRLAAFATQAAVAFENAQLYQKIRQHAAELEQRVAERTADLSAANAELARGARLKDEFLASMSHELRTPLNAILGMSEALQEQTFGPVNEEQFESLQDIVDSGRHLLTLINDILDLSKIEAGKLALQIDSVVVESISQASLRLIKQSAHQKRLKVLYTLDEMVTAIRADERYLKQILVNLLSNAVKFTPEGGRIGLEIMGDAPQGVVRFTVWDTGIGIPTEDMGQLFQPFVQLDRRLDRQYGGTGLGLALVYRMTELHGGSVSVTSELKKGSRFTITLPWIEQENPVDVAEVSQIVLPVVSPQTDSAPRALTDAQIQSSGDKPLILMAEDNESNIKTISRYLNRVGYRVEVALNGIEAITQARVLRADLILMDIQMPEMDGLEAIRHLRADPYLGAIPIIALTALAMAGDRERCLAAGANAYLSKPVNLKLLVETIETQLTQSGDPKK